MIRRDWGFVVLPLALVGLAACGEDAKDDAALDGAGGGACAVEDRGDGTAVIRCADGSEFTVGNGKPGADGKDGKDGEDGAKGEDGKDAEEPPCSLSENEDGTQTLTCGDQSVVVGAPCEGGFPGTLSITKEDDVAAASNLLLFQVSTCTWVRGSVVVAQFPGETLPQALARIQKVDGDVVITNNADLTIASLPALTTVGGAVLVGQNAALTETSFPALATVGKDLVWYYNPALVSVGELPKLIEVKGTLGWLQNPNVERTPDFPELTAVGTDLGWVENQKLVGTGAYPKLKSVGSFLGWRGNVSLEDLGSFGALESVDGFEIRQNGALEAVVDFPKLTTVGGDGVLITNNASLTALEGLGSITKVTGPVTIQDNPKLPVCDVWDWIGEIQDAEGVDGPITVTNNDNTDDSCLVL